jgi:DNA-binding HxlR family transcriptional regulator
MGLIVDVFSRDGNSEAVEIATGKAMKKAMLHNPKNDQITDTSLVNSVRAAVIPCLHLLSDRRPRTLDDFKNHLGLPDAVLEQTLELLSHLKFISIRQSKQTPVVYSMVGKYIRYRPPFKPEIPGPVQYLLVLFDGEKSIFELSDILNRQPYTARSTLQYLEKAGLVKRTGPRSNRLWALTQIT